MDQASVHICSHGRDMLHCIMLQPCVQLEKSEHPHPNRDCLSSTYPGKKIRAGSRWPCGPALCGPPRATPIQPIPPRAPRRPTGPDHWSTQPKEETMTINKFFGISFGHAKLNPFDLSEFDVIVFDEMYFSNLSNLSFGSGTIGNITRKN